MRAAPRIGESCTVRLGGNFSSTTTRLKPQHNLVYSMFLISPLVGRCRRRRRLTSTVWRRSVSIHHMPDNIRPPSSLIRFVYLPRNRYAILIDMFYSILSFVCALHLVPSRPLAFSVRVIKENFGIKHGCITTVHNVTATQVRPYTHFQFGSHAPCFGDTIRCWHGHWSSS